MSARQVLDVAYAIAAESYESLDKLDEALGILAPVLQIKKPITTDLSKVARLGGEVA